MRRERYANSNIFHPVLSFVTDPSLPAGHKMNPDPRVRRDQLRSLLLQRTSELNGHIRHVAFSINAMDEGFDPVFDMPTEDTYPLSDLLRFYRIIRDSIRMLVCLKSHIHQYRDGMRAVRDRMSAITRGPMLDRRAPLGENQLHNSFMIRRGNLAMNDATGQNPRAPMGESGDENRP